MIRSAVVAIVAMFAATQVMAQAVKQVEVANFPDPQSVVGQVEVTNLPACETTVRFQLVGFTSDVFTGDLGGPFGATEKCQAEFVGSRMCNSYEAQTTDFPPAVRPAAAWINTIAGDSAGGTVGVVGGIGYYCRQWTSTDLPAVALKSGGNIEGGSPCSAEHPIACCALVP
jgi:hypothetical protein